jgi:hypothetical protein
MSGNSGQSDPWVRVRRSLLQAMHAAATVGHGTERTLQEGYALGRQVGREEGRRAAEQDQVARIEEEKAAQQGIAHALSEAARIEGLRWRRPGERYGHRETYGQPVPGEYMGGRADAHPEGSSWAGRGFSRPGPGDDLGRAGRPRPQPVPTRAAKRSPAGRQAEIEREAG